MGSNGRVALANRIALERSRAVCSVVDPGITHKGSKTSSRVIDAIRIVCERLNAGRRVGVPGRVLLKGVMTNGRVISASGVAKEGSATDCRVRRATYVAIQRLKTNGCVV